MILRNLKRLSYCIAWLISWALVYPLIGSALPLLIAAMCLARSRDQAYVLNHPGAGGQLMRWVNGWKFANRYLQWVERFTGIYH